MKYKVANPIDFEQRERDMDKFIELCQPLVEYFQEHWNPSTRVVIDWGGVSIFDKACRIPIEVPDSTEQSKKGDNDGEKFDKEYLDKWRRVLEFICPPEFLLELQKQAPYLKFDIPDKPNPAHLQL